MGFKSAARSEISNLLCFKLANTQRSNLNGVYFWEDRIFPISLPRWLAFQESFFFAVCILPPSSMAFHSLAGLCSIRAGPLLSPVTYRLPSALIGVFLQLRSFSTFITFLFSCCTQKTMWFPFLSNWNYTTLNTSQSCYEDKKGHRWESTFCKRLCAVQVLVYLVVDCIPITFPPSLLNSSIT